MREGLDILTVDFFDEHSLHWLDGDTDNAFSLVQGNVELLVAQDAEDGHDAVEQLAKLPYCNDNIGFAGNSALAISQYFIAAQQPPSLKAIAPWEGLGDMHREQFNRGGMSVELPYISPNFSS